MRLVMNSDAGELQKRIDQGVCVKCKTTIDYSVNPAVCKACGLTIHNAQTTKDMRDERKRT